MVVRGINQRACNEAREESDVHYAAEWQRFGKVDLDEAAEPAHHILVDFRVWNGKNYANAIEHLIERD
jgi:hypothetical protein